MAEENIPRTMDVPGECSSYDENEITSDRGAVLKAALIALAIEEEREDIPESSFETQERFVFLI